MSRAFHALNLILVLVFSGHVGAQLESSSAVLLKPSGKGPSKQKLDSSRYKIRAPESNKGSDDLEEKPGTVIPSPVRKSEKTVATSTTTTTLEVTPEPPPPTVVVPTPIVQPEPTPQPEPVVQPAPAEPPPVTEQVTDLILGGSQEEIKELKSQIHPDDPRQNVLDISVAPAYFYNGSESGYSFRDYDSNGPGLGLGANLWLTPLFAIHANYFTSFSSAVRSGGANMVSMDVQTLEAGIRFRKHFGLTRKAASLNWGIDYYDAVNKIDKDATTVVGRKSSGLALSFGANIPTSNTYAHTFQADVRPKMKHSEQSTSVEVKSGSKAETNGLSLSLGGEWTLDRRNQFFWKGQYNVERNLFKGSASQMDPHDGQTPDGVSVTNSLAIFYFGFKWGS